MLTPTAAWLEAASSGREPRALLSITRDGITFWKCLSGSCDLIDYPVAISAVSSIGIEIDPLTRAMQTSECVVDVLDGFIRPILVNNRLRGMKASVTFGFKGIAESDFLAMFSGPIGDIAPDGLRDSGVVSISIMDLMSIFEDRKLVGSWFNTHPLTILYDGASPGRSILSQCGYNSSTFVDEASFNPEDARYVDTISHWCMSKVSPNDIFQPVSAAALVGDLCQLMVGSIVADENGVLAFRLFDPAGSAVAAFTVDDILPGSFKQSPVDANVVNRINLRLAGGRVRVIDREASDTMSGNYVGKDFDVGERIIEINDSDSQTAYAYPGQTSRILSHDLDTVFCPLTDTPLRGNLTAGSTSMFIVGEVHGWTGRRGLIHTGPTDITTALSQHASATISATRPGYFLIDNVNELGGSTEIVKAEAATTYPTSVDGYPQYMQAKINDFWVEDPAYSWSYQNYWCQITLSSMTRGQFGTTAQAHDSGWYYDKVWDVTPSVSAAEKILQRFKYGCPVVEFETPINRMQIQIADIVTLTYPHFVGYGKDGVTTSSTWEVVGKEVDLIASPPKIKWILAMANATASVTPGLGKFFGAGEGLRADASFIESQDSAEQSIGFVSNGFIVSVVSGLTISITAGAVLSGHARSTRGTATQVTLLASKDYYVSFDPVKGTFSFAYVANGASAPVKPSAEVWIAKCVTNATDVTSITDLRETLPYAGSSLKPGTGPLTHLSGAGIIDNLTSVGATTAQRTLDNIGDGSTYARTLGAALSSGKINLTAGTAGFANTLPEAQIGNGAVTTAKIGGGAVGVYQSRLADVRTVLNRNAVFLQRTRG